MKLIVSRTTTASGMAVFGSLSVATRSSVSSAAALFEGRAETFELFPLEAEAGAELEATARDDINRRDILCEAHGIVKRHQEHSGYDADPVGTGGNRRGYGQNRG